MKVLFPKHRVTAGAVIYEYWNNTYAQSTLLPDTGDWLEKYSSMLEQSRDRAILDLGCGLGNNSLYLYEKGYRTWACDIAEEALKKVRQFVPGIETKCFDMAEGLPFDTASIKVVVADLSLHYFTDEITFKIVGEINRVLENGGLFLCRLNSTKDLINKPNAVFLDRHLYDTGGILRRFFDAEEVERFFGDEQWEALYRQEYETYRYTNKKTLWELALRKKGGNNLSQPIVSAKC